MLCFYPSAHVGHAPATEFYRGDRVPCFETPARVEIVRTELLRRGHTLAEPQPDCADVLAQVHDERYIRFLQDAWNQWLVLDPGNVTKQPFPSAWPVRTLRSDVEPDNFIAKLGLYSMDNGTPMTAGTWHAARQAANAAHAAALHLAGGGRAAFACVRPPGHHAGADFMGGYCFLNNTAVAAQTLRNGGAQRVTILDVDYHHGNGTQSIFYDRADVLFVSIHGDPRTEYPFYLGHADETGSGAGAGFNLNLPLPAGVSVARWFEALDTACHRAIAHRPDALVVSLGLDTHADDPISKFGLQADDFLRLGERLAQLELQTAFVLEGGYAASALGVNAANVLDGFENASIGWTGTTHFAPV